MKLARFALTAIAAVATSWTALAADISGAGATFPYPVYAKWADAYKKETGIGLNYQSIGSGGGSIVSGFKPGSIMGDAGPAPVMALPGHPAAAMASTPWLLPGSWPPVII